MTNERLRHVLETLVREAQAVADDHHQPRYARLDEALELAREVLGSPVEPSAEPECVYSQVGVINDSYEGFTTMEGAEGEPVYVRRAVSRT